MKQFILCHILILTFGCCAPATIVLYCIVQLIVIKLMNFKIGE